jgi:multiple sugar transport system ATP-binding protein
MFVARFVGSPVINTFDVVLFSDGISYYVDAGPFRLKVPNSKVPAWAPYAGKRVVLGIRPEDIHHPEYTHTTVAETRVKATVALREALGHETYLHLKSDKLRFTTRVDPRANLYHDQEIDITLNMEKAHLFDAETEKAIY